MGQSTRRVLIVNECGAFWPSGYVRALQYKSLFDACPEWDAEFTTRRSEPLARLGADRRIAVRAALKPFRKQLSGYVSDWEKRQEDRIVRSALAFDIVIINKSPGIELYKRLRDLNGQRIIMDINDAVWLPAFGWNDLTETLSIVDAVICENEYIAGYARRHNQDVWVIPDAPQIEVFDRFRSSIRRDTQSIVVGWIGARQNVGPLIHLAEPLEKLFRRYESLRLRVVGAGPSDINQLRSLRHSCRPSFDQIEMVSEVLRFDIGLFPLLRDEDGLARGTLKAMVYMSGEAAVVAEYFGENPNLINNNINGLLASSPEEWYDCLERLVIDSPRRNIISRNGLETIRDKFTAERIFEKMIEVYDATLD